MDKIHIYRNDAKTFGGRTNKYLTRIGRICGGQDGVSIPSSFILWLSLPSGHFVMNTYSESRKISPFLQRWI